tara:strand:- start:639 stop:971 length:333 start_codon:yes stop_codon:yes gene_type:complete
MLALYNCHFTARKLGAIGSFEDFSVLMRIQIPFTKDEMRIKLGEFFQDIHSLKYSVRVNHVDKFIDDICTREILGNGICRVYETDSSITLKRYRDATHKQFQSVEWSKHS